MYADVNEEKEIWILLLYPSSGSFVATFPSREGKG